MSSYAIGVDDVRMAAKRIAPYVLRTPVVQSPTISQRLDIDLHFKCENMQHVGAFKARGACNAVMALSESDADTGVVAHSSGNHAAALARAAKIRGISASIVMPHNSASLKIEAVRALGVEPIFCEPDAESRQAGADKVIAETGATFIHPYNNPHVMAGQGTVALELLDQVKDPDAIVVPVGGGGLLGGVLIAAKSVNPQLKIYAAEPAWADDAARSLQSGSIQMPTRYDTVADGLRTPLGTLTFPIIRDLVEDVLLADESTIEASTALCLREAKIQVEPSGAVPLAAVIQNSDLFAGKRVALVVSGGNIESSSLCRILTETASS